MIYSDSGIISDWFSDNGLGARGCMLCINIPEYTTFKDGDVLSNEEGDHLFILNTNGSYLTSYYVSWREGGCLYFNNGAANENNIERYRFATEDERQRFVDALKTSEEPKAKICLKQFFGIEIEPKYKFKPLEEIPCPFCRTEEFIRYDPFNKEYSMDSEEDIRDWYMSYINEMRNKYGGK